MEEEKLPQNPKKYPTLGEYILLKTLGKGYNSKVKLGYHKGNGSHYAVKIIHAQNYLQNLKTIKNEVEMMLKLKHQNILNLFEYKENEEYFKTNGEKRNVMYIALELAEGGELFEYVANCGSFSEEVARTYFHQLIEGLSYCHKQEITHRDIKPENLLFDKDFVLKLADFGFSTLLSGRDGSGYNRTILGTESYMAPEIHARQPYKGDQVDLFASAIILFIMYGGTPPFTQATPRDAYYKLIANGKYETFWTAHARYKPKGYYSDQFKDFINKMLAYYPNQRINIDQIKQHPWYCGAVVTQEEIIKEFQNRKKVIDIELEKERLIKEQQKQMKKGQNLVFTGIGGFRGLSDFTEFEGLDQKFPTIEAKRVLYQSERKEKKLQNFYTVVDAEYLWYFALKKLNECSIDNIQINKEKYKIVCTVMGELEKTEIEMKLNQMSDDVIEVEFNKKLGPTADYFKNIQMIKEKLRDLKEKEKEISQKEETN